MTTIGYNNLKVGQVWIPEDKNDYTLEIIGLTSDEVEVKEVETGEVYSHELDGSDGFSDYLEENGYTL